MSNLWLLETGSDVSAFYLAIVQDDRTDEPPSAAGQFAPVHQVLQFTDLDGALKPAHIQPNYLSTREALAEIS